MPDIEHLDMRIDWSALTETEQITLHQLLTKAHSSRGNLPKTYAEIEYTSEQLENDPIAIEGARFDDMNYLHYTER